MIVLFTDFGSRSPYVGQLHSILIREAPGVAIVDLLHDAPAHNPRASAYLLAAYAKEFAVGSVFLAVVDPGVGGERGGLMVNAGGRWFVGPQNGLFDPLLRRSRSSTRCWRITWQPAHLSESFHGRDLFGPVAGRLAAGHSPLGEPQSVESSFGHPEWPDDLEEVVYVDHFGNAITGVRALLLPHDALIMVKDRILHRASTFSSVERGGAFWYENSSGLVELAVNSDRADIILDIGVGTRITVCNPHSAGLDASNV